MDDAAVLDLNDFFYFVQVVDRSGFTAAGRMLHIPKSTQVRRSTAQSTLPTPDI
jgi:DNA-binding transcriptional LysR family regulator